MKETVTTGSYQRTTQATETSDDMSDYQSRRNFLGATGLALTPPTILSRTYQQTAGKIVFTYDDGYRPDYTKTFPIHREEDAPASAAIPSTAIGRTRKHLTMPQVYEMVDDGWEIMSHGAKHEALGPVPITEDISPGDTHIHVQHPVLGRTPNLIEIHDGTDQLAVAALTGKSSSESYLTLAAPVDVEIEAGTCFIRFQKAVIETVLENSKKSLRNRGFDVTNFVLPYDRHDEQTRSMVPDYYDAVANVHQGGINRRGELDPYGLHRIYFRDGFMTKSAVENRLDQIAEADALGIFGGHSGHDRLTRDRIRLAIREARKRNLEIVTLQTALDEFDSSVL